MIKSIRLTNFFSFADTTIHFQKGANILIGINGSGKSNLLKAFQLLEEGLSGKPDALKNLIRQWGGFDNIFCKTSNKINEIELEFVLDGQKINSYVTRQKAIGDIHYLIKMFKDGEGNLVEEKLFDDGSEDGGFLFMSHVMGEQVIYTSKQINATATRKVDKHELSLTTGGTSQMVVTAVTTILKSLSVYSFLDTSSESPIRKSGNATSSFRHLLPNGENIIPVLNTLKISNKNAYRKLIEKIQEINPHFEEIDFYNYGAGMMKLMLSEKGFNESVPIEHVSDGTLKMVYLLTILCNPDRGNVVCIDEPEANLHPNMLHTMATMLHDITDTTFLIATHSDIFLDCFEPEQVHIFEKDKNNTTIVTQKSREELKKWDEEYSMGDLWLSGDLGGV